MTVKELTAELRALRVSGGVLEALKLVAWSRQDGNITRYRADKFRGQIKDWRRDAV